MGKKKLLKKFFGKSSRKSKGANSSPVTSAVVAADQTSQERPHPVADAGNCAPVEHDPSSSPRSAAACVNDAAQSDSVTSGTVSNQSGGPRPSPGVGVEVEVEQPLAATLMEEAAKNEPETTFDKVPEAEDENSELPPTTADLNAEVETDAPADAASGMVDVESDEKCMGVENKALLVEALPAGIQTDAAADPLPERVDAASDENRDIRENKASGSREATSVEMKVVNDGELKCGGGEDVALENQSPHDEHEGKEEGSGGEEVQKRNKKKWAEEKISQLNFSSCSKPTERLKVDVGEGLNAERRKWVEGLSTPKDRSPSLVPGDAKNVGKISDKWKAVEQSFQKKERGPVPISRGNASKRWKAVEEERRKQSNPKAAPVTPSPNKASEKKKAVEDMLQQLVKKEVSSTESSLPGRERLKSQKRFVLDVLEKQNDPKHFLDSKRDEKHSLDMGKESVGQKNGIEEIKIQMKLEGKGCDVANMVEGAEENEDKGNESLSEQAIPANKNTQDL